jgi:hypothetical protein
VSRENKCEGCELAEGRNFASERVFNPTTVKFMNISLAE